MTYKERCEQCVRNMDGMEPGTKLSYYDDDYNHAEFTKQMDGTWRDMETGVDYDAGDVACYIQSGQATAVMFIV